MQLKGTGNPLFLRDAELNDSLELMLQAHLRLLSSADRHLTSEKLHQTDLLVLFFVTRNPDTTSSELSTIMGQSKQNLSRHINGLIEKNLLIRARDEGDKRRQLLRPSDKGELLVATIIGEQRDQLRQAFRNAGHESVEGFRAVIEALVPLASQQAAKRSSKNTLTMGETHE